VWIGCFGEAEAPTNNKAAANFDAIFLRDFFGRVVEASQPLKIPKIKRRLIISLFSYIQDKSLSFWVILCIPAFILLPALNVSHSPV
jgi:hypothetical protein